MPAFLAPLAALFGGGTAAGAAGAAGPTIAGSALKWGLGTLAGIGAWEGVSRLVHGSMEDQMRQQMEIGERLEMERAMRGGRGGPMPSEAELAGLVGGGRRSLTDLMAEDEIMREVAQTARSMDRLKRVRPYGSRDLENILAGETARIAALQSPRALTPLEVIQMLEEMGA